MEQRGFSLIEVLITLILSTSISLALLKQQWQITRLRIQIQQQNSTWLHEHNQREQGFGLLECLIGTMLALTMLSILLQQYVQIKFQTELARQAMQTESRVDRVLELLKNSGHQAGFTPCLPIGDLQSFDHRNGRNLQAIRIDKLGNSKLILQRMTHFIPALAHRQANHFTLNASWKSKSHNPVIIADCQHAEVLDQYQIKAQSIQFFHTLKYIYHPPIYIGEWLSESFWVKPNLNGQPALFYQAHQQAEELSSDIQILQSVMVTKRQKHFLQIWIGKKQVIPYFIRLYHV